MLHTPFPLPALWTTRLDWFFMAIFPPLVDRSAGRVVARCGVRLVSCRCDDGSVAWSAEIDPEGGNGAFFLGHGDMYLTEQARLPPSCMATIVAVDAGGQQRWRTDLDTMVALGGAAVHGDELCALSLSPASEKPTLLYRLALADGALRGQEALPWPADAVLPVAGGLLARNQRVADGAPGLYLVDAAGSHTALLADAVIELAREADLLVVITRAGGSHTARVYTAGSMEPLWQAPIAGPAAALAGNDLLHIEDADHDKASTLVCRDARTGAVRWRSAPLPPQIPSISVAGAIALCNHRKGQVVCRRRDGHVMGEVRGSYGPPAQHGDCLYLCRPGALLCVSLEGVDELGALGSPAPVD
jgi:PQQ-like domain